MHPLPQVAPKLHDLRVRKVQEQVRRWNAAGLRGKKTMCTARASWLTMSTRTATFKEVRSNERPEYYWSLLRVWTGL